MLRECLKECPSFLLDLLQDPLGLRISQEYWILGAVLFPLTWYLECHFILAMVRLVMHLPVMVPQGSTNQLLPVVANLLVIAHPPQPLNATAPSLLESNHQESALHLLLVDQSLEQSADLLLALAAGLLVDLQLNVPLPAHLPGDKGLPHVREVLPLGGGVPGRKVLRRKRMMRGPCF